MVFKVIVNDNEERLTMLHKTRVLGTDKQFRILISRKWQWKLVSESEVKMWLLDLEAGL